MMKALAGVSAAAVALVALPTAVGVAADPAPVSTAVAGTVSTAGHPAASEAAASSTQMADFFTAPMVLGLNLLTVLWLSVAVVAAFWAVFAVGRSRGRQVAGASILELRPSTPAPVGQPSYVIADGTSAGR